MRWLIALVLSLLVAQSSAQVPSSHAGLGTPATGGGGSPTLTLGSAVAIQVHGFAAGTVTFSGLNGSVNFPSGAKVYVAVGQDQGATTLTSPQIGGNAASIVTGSQDSSTKCTFYSATMASASTDNFTFTNGGAVDRIGVVSVYMTNVTLAPTAASNETFGASANPQTPGGAITVPSTGFGVAMVWGRSAGTPTPPDVFTWTLTTALNGDITPTSLSPFAAIGLAHTATSGSWLPTVTDVASNNALGFAACMSTIAVGP